MPVWSLTVNSAKEGRGVEGRRIRVADVRQLRGRQSRPEARARNPAKGLKAAIIPVTPFQQNCTLIWDPATMVGAVVDPGGDLDHIERAIAEVGMKPEKILLTHGHIDHAGGAAELKERLGVPIEGPHEKERPLLDGLEQAGQGLRHGGAPGDARPLARGRRHGDGRRAHVRHPALPRAFAGVGRVREQARSASRSWAMCCSAARSAARICRSATTRR